MSRPRQKCAAMVVTSWCVCTMRVTVTFKIRDVKFILETDSQM